jgi:hypothetical protein
MADDPKARKFYVSWVDRRKDPWPKWADRTDGQPSKKGKALRLCPAEDPEWPGVPRLVDEQQPWLHLGPTLTALFHPNSPYCNLRHLDRVYLVYEPELGKRSPHEKLRDVLERLCRARQIPDFQKRLRLAPIAGIADHTDHKQVLQRLEDWICGDEDPFNLRRKAGKNSPHIVINLGPGTPAKHACWLMLHWKGVLGDAPSTFVKFVQGDAGLYGDEAQREPIRDVPIDVLSRFIGKEARVAAPPAAEDWVRLEDLRSAPYEDLRKTIEQAALLGLPIVLYGERGTGKTFLARYYHERRQFYRRIQAGPADPGLPAAGRNSFLRAPSNAPAAPQEGSFVPVTLSEYANLHELRDHLFGWARGSWTGAQGEYHGLLGMAHRGTLLLDEVHHLDRTLQASLLGVLNNRRYRPKMADYEVQSDFDLVVGTNDPRWRDTLADDFRDRIERIVLEVPPFRVLQRHDLADLWGFWEFTVRRRCRECGVEYAEPPPDCRAQLEGVFRHQPLHGNWRDLMRLADQVLLLLTAARGGRPTPLTWSRDLLDKAVFQTFRAARAGP